MIEHKKEIVDEAPPFLKTWPRVYRFVLVYVALVILALWAFTKYYAPAQ
jgi:hypothetical protein